MRVLITGGAGFIGCNLAEHLIRAGHEVALFDNLSRRGADANLEWLRGQFGGGFRFIRGDVRDARAIAEAAAGQEAIYHLAAQVAVTTSVVNPREDFEINALGTFNVLEAARAAGTNPIVIFASTNKVYGGMEDAKVVEAADHYRFADLPHGVPETWPLDFHSPYGTSKGSGDQYTRDYARIYGLPTVVFRQSCLAADQDVLTPFGKKRIQELQPGDIVHGGHGWTRVVRVWQTGVKSVRRLTTVNGLSVTLTEDHRVVRPHGLLPNRDFAYGDFLAVLPEALFAPRWEPIPDRVLNPDCFLDAVRARTDDRRCLTEAERIAARLLPLRGDTLLAITEIVGRLFGDGHLSTPERQSREMPSYYGQHFGEVKELEEVAERLEWLGLPASGIIRWPATSRLPGGHVIQGHSCRIQQQSIPIFTLFERLGVPVGDKVRADFGLPDWVMTGHRLVKRAFLRGCLGAEMSRVDPSAYVPPSFAQSKDVAVYSNGARWVQQMRDLLAEFGLETTCFDGEPVEYKRGTTVQTTVRLLGGRSMFERLAAVGYAFSRDRSTRLNALLRWQWEHTSADRFDALEKIHRADGQLLWDSLASVEPLGEQAVYDLEVEADSHLFVAGGIQVSNCIYGQRQFGIEDQGWLAHFVISAVLGRPISIYGDGKQVRDVLHVDDLVRAFVLATERIEVTRGKIYNIGGGPEKVLSVWAQTGPILERLAGRKLDVRYGDWRPGDQRIYVSDIRKAKVEFGWEPRITPEAGLKRLWEWVGANRGLFQ